MLLLHEYGQKHKIAIQQAQSAKVQRKKQVNLEMSYIHSLEPDRKQTKDQAIEKCVMIYFNEDENPKSKR